MIELPVKHPELFESLGIAQPKVFFFGADASALDGACGRGRQPKLASARTIVGIRARSAAQGVLLYGPPGTGKTLLARAVAHHTDCTFIRVSGSELVQKYIGEGSRMVRELFVMARYAHRCAWPAVSLARR